MMLGGAILLALAFITREHMTLQQLSFRSGMSLLYLITFGSLVGFTAFVWLLGKMPASRVASHAYVNPVVALCLGCCFAGEKITAHMIIGAAIVLFSVVLILRHQNGELVPVEP